MEHLDNDMDIGIRDPNDVDDPTYMTINDWISENPEENIVIVLPIIYDTLVDFRYRFRLLTRSELKPLFEETNKFVECINGIKTDTIYVNIAVLEVSGPPIAVSFNIFERLLKNKTNKIFLLNQPEAEDKKLISITPIHPKYAEDDICFDIIYTEIQYIKSLRDLIYENLPEHQKDPGLINPETGLV